MKRIIIAALLLTGACKKDHDTQSEAIVEAWLLPRQLVSIRIGDKISRGLTDTLITVKGLSPVLVQNHTEYPLKYTSKGVYSNPDIMLQEKDSCHLYFKYNGKEVSAHTVIPEQPTGFTCNTNTLKVTNFNNPVFDPRQLEFKWNNPGNDFHMVVFQKEGIQPWWIRPGNTGAGILKSFNTKPTNATSESFQATGILLLSEKHQMMLYRILPEYAFIFNEIDYKSQHLTKPHSNITNANGVFAGMSISDTLILNVVQ